MKISLEWLSDFIDLVETDPQRIADRLTAATGEVEDVERQGALLHGCVVGKVTNLRKHPGADKLSLCDVQTEQGPKKIVCGGTNLKDGMLVAFAHVGATVKHGKETFTLSKAKIRGEESEGMICAAEELELTERFPPAPEDGPRPVIDLTPANYKPGTTLRDALGLTDVILHIDNHAITNRPDLFSHTGVARELVALGLATWKKQPQKKQPTFAKKKLPFACNNDVPGLVPRYFATLIELGDKGVTPDWMKRRLEAVGWRSINLAVDITNYVATETGMPLHSFDADDFAGDITIRAAKRGEKLVTLDGVERTLNEGAVVIADDKGIFDLLGIMGGLRGSSKDSTRRVYLHSAIVDGPTIRKSVIAIGHRTDAATVYEKGIPLVTAEAGFLRALELFLELVPGARIVSEKETWGDVTKRKPVKIEEERISRAIGEDIPPAKVKSILNDLGFSVTKAGKTLSVLAPDWRNDISQPADIIEEVARIHGYDRIPATLPSARLDIPHRDPRANQVRDTLKENGYHEALHLAFANAAQLAMFGMDAAKAVSIENPIGEETSLMRMSLLPSLAQTVASQLKHSETTLKMYEIGHVFTKGSEHGELCLLAAAKDDTGLQNDPVLIVKADLQEAFKAAGHTVDIAPAADDLPPYAHPGRSGTILCNGKAVGLLTELNPQTRDAAGLPYRTACAILDWDAVTALKPKVTLSAPLSAFPSVVYDETVPMQPDVRAKDLIAKLSKTDPLLTSVEIIDLYEKDADKRVTLRFTYRSPDRTLQQCETDAAHAKILAGLRS